MEVYVLTEDGADVGSCVFFVAGNDFAFEIKTRPLLYSPTRCDGYGWLLDLCQSSGHGDDCFIIRPCVNLGMLNGCRTCPSIRALGDLREPENWWALSSRE